MEIEYAPSPIVYLSADDVYYAFTNSVVHPDGSIKTRYWNHAAPAWDDVFDPAAHVKQASVLGDDAANKPYHAFGMPFQIVNATGLRALIYKKSSDGSYEAVAHFSKNFILSCTESD